MATTKKVAQAGAVQRETEVAPREFKHEVLTIRITKEGMNWLREVATRKQVAPSTLARMWIFEHLSKEPPPKGGLMV